MFLLAYAVPGFSIPMLELDADEREWFLRRVKKQKEDEANAIRNR